MLLLEQNTIRKKQVNEFVNELLKPRKEFEARNKMEYEIKVIIDSVIYGQKTNS